MNMFKNATSRVLQILGVESLPMKQNFKPNENVTPDSLGAPSIPPDIDDLVRLYCLVRSRRVTTILEFGSGFSTLVMAAALEENRQDFSDNPDFLALRRNSPFEIHSVEGSEKWLENTKGKVRGDCKERCNFHYSPSVIGTFAGRIVHYYEKLPNICPDFIYLDGPSAYDVKGEVGGLGFCHEDRTVISADIARMEWLLLPGCYIVVDGRTNNARFLKSNFQRNWQYHYDVVGDFHTFELVEEPLGRLNRKQMEFCLSGIVR